MKLLFLFLLIGFMCNAQEEIAHTVSPPSGPKIYYFPIYNDTQMVEIDLFNQSLRYSSWMNETTPRGESWYAEAVALDQTNVYILRNGKGEIIAGYGGLGEAYAKSFHLLSPATAPTITHKERLQQQKANVSKINLTWQDANGYGYRFTEIRVREQLTEMPEAPYNVYGMIDTLGRVVIPPDQMIISYLNGEYLAQRDQVSFGFNRGNLATSGGGFGLYDARFNCLWEQNYGSVKRLSGGKYTYHNNGTWIVNVKGELLDTNRYDDVWTNQFNDHFIFKIMEGSKQQNGVLNSKLEKVVSADYSWIVAMEYGFLGFDNTGTAAIINLSGEQISGFDFGRYTVGYHDGYYVAQTTIDQQKFRGVVDTIGDTLIPFKYEHLSYFEENLAKVFIDNKWGIVNRKGEELTPIKYDYIGELTGDYIIVQNNNKWGLLSANGEELLEPKYLGISCHNTHHIFYRNDEKQWYLLNGETGKSKKLPYDQVYCFDWEYARVIQNKKYGLIDKDGKEVLKPEYDIIGGLNNHQMLVKKGDYYGILNADLKWDEPLKYHHFKSGSNGRIEVY